jgi:hypothetical protein
VVTCLKFKPAHHYHIVFDILSALVISLLLSNFFVGLSYEFMSIVPATRSRLGRESQVLAMAGGALGKSFDDGKKRRVDGWER